MKMSDLKWLVNTPAHDINFECALKRASEDTIREDLEAVARKSGKKTVERKLRAKLKALEKAPRMLGAVRYEHWNCKAVLQRQHNGRPVIVLVDRTDESQIAVATVNVPEISLADDEIVVKDYSENAGMLAALADAGILIDTGKIVPLGHAVGKLCRLANRRLSE